MQMTVAGFIVARTTTKSFVPFVEARQDDIIEICSPGRYGLNPAMTQLDRADPLLVLLLCPLGNFY